MRGIDFNKIINHATTLFLLLLFSMFYFSCDKDSVSSKDQTVGKFLNYSDCGGFETSKRMLNLPNNQSGIFYQYDGSGKLEFQHINAGFNCCPVLSADITFSNDTEMPDYLDRERP